jgi:hypothetical protein
MEFACVEFACVEAGDSLAAFACAFDFDFD